MRGLLVVGLVLLLSGCAFLTPKIELYPISQKDIISVPKGAKCGESVVESNGWFLSDLYVETVMKAKVK